MKNTIKIGMLFLSILFTSCVTYKLPKTVGVSNHCYSGKYKPFKDKVPFKYTTRRTLK